MNLHSTPQLRLVRARLKSLHLEEVCLQASTRDTDLFASCTGTYMGVDRRHAVASMVELRRRLPPLEDRRSGCVLHGLFRLPATSAKVATHPNVPGGLFLIARIRGQRRRLTYSVSLHAPACVEGPALTNGEVLTKWAGGERFSPITQTRARADRRRRGKGLILTPYTSEGDSCAPSIRVAHPLSDAFANHDAGQIGEYATRCYRMSLGLHYASSLLLAFCPKSNRRFNR